MAADDYHETDDGYWSFFVETVEVVQIKARLERHGIRVLSDKDAVFNRVIGNLAELIVEVDDTDDIDFALDDAVKLIRPYPKQEGG